MTTINGLSPLATALLGFAAGVACMAGFDRARDWWWRACQATRRAGEATAQGLLRVLLLFGIGGGVLVVLSVIYINLPDK
jgi:hypothetical protein